MIRLFHHRRFFPYKRQRYYVMKDGRLRMYLGSGIFSPPVAGAWAPSFDPNPEREETPPIRPLREDLAVLTYQSKRR